MPCGTLLHVIWDQPLQTLADIAGLSCGVSSAVLEVLVQSTTKQGPSKEKCEPLHRAVVIPMSHIFQDEYWFFSLLLAAF